MENDRTLSQAARSEFVDDEIIELSLADLDYVSGAAAGKCEASGTCDKASQ